MLLLRELAVAASLLVGVDAAFYSSKSAVVNLDHKNFGKEILNFDNAAIVEFYAPWCGHCQNLKPVYDKAATSLKGIAKVAAIDCDNEKNKRTCGEYGVQGFPTLKLFVPSGKTGKPIVEDYTGPRTVKAITDALAERIPNRVTKLTAPKLDDFLSKKNETAKAILFTKKGTTGALWKSLAIDFEDSIIFTQIRDKEKDVAERFGITKFPTIVLLPGGDAEGKVFEGKIEKQALFDFFAATKPPKVVDQPASEDSKSSKDGKKPSFVVQAEKLMPVDVPTISALPSLRSICFAKNSKTCVLAISDEPLESVAEVYIGLLARPSLQVFQVFRVESKEELAKLLQEHLGLGSELPQLVAVNHRGWFRRFDGDIHKPLDILEWLDAIKLGDLPKGMIPKAILGSEEDKQKKEEPPGETETETAEKTGEGKDEL
ncbi:hypothetical protein FN846DRAFT_886957 [Sphaerosporella brunnea]|uniref:protein disulfide-isomerase n=1 Tax=Sphaerosporella brunnea TaxID=1250544 RepID=A0A5J5F774_9PEZI|nr:hypothetical protein FN846DRAFT_886957 [Sphaerosporella brunnea]